MNFFRSMLATADGTSGDIVRVLMGMSSLVHMGLTVHGAVTGAHPYDPMAFTGAQAAIFAAGGGTLLMKKSTEPGGQG